jgi:hypothetical protein
VTGPTLLRATLAAVAASNLMTGLTALLTPRAFYADFPFGLGWVAELPPFNEHLTTDVGAFYLALPRGAHGWPRGRRRRGADDRSRRGARAGGGGGGGAQTVTAAVQT